MISLKNINKKFGDFTAVDDLTFDVEDNEIFGLLGPNGAGKTTTINMICGLLTPTNGSITFTGYGGINPKSLIGYCPQENIFYPKLTCLEQLIFTGQLYGLAKLHLRQKAEELLEQLGLKEKINARADSLSGGMKRRLNICLALLHDPEILILDEPEAGLDPQSRILVREFIKACGKTRTVLLSTHNMDEADRLADRIAIIDHGKLLLVDSPANLKKSIGEGDLLELFFETSDASTLTILTEQYTAAGTSCQRNGSTLLLRQPGILAKLPEIKSIAERLGAGITELKLRTATLEDVFIHLTGRNLRP